MSKSWIVFMLMLAPLPIARATPRPPLLDFTQDNHATINAGMLTDDQQDTLLQTLYPPPQNDCGEEFWGDHNMQSVNGSFTDPQANETLITFVSAPCGTHAGVHGNLVILRQGRLVIWNNTLPAGQIELVKDIDGDGMSEVVVSLSDGGQGDFQTTAATVSFKNHGIQTMNYISGEVNHSQCFSDSGKVYSSVFYPATSGNGVEQQNFVRKCSEDRSAYKFFSYGELHVAGDE